MTQLADPSIVMGNFDGQSVDTREGAYKLFEEGGVCWGEIPNQVLRGSRVAAPGASRVPLVMTTLISPHASLLVSACIRTHLGTVSSRLPQRS